MIGGPGFDFSDPGLYALGNGKELTMVVKVYTYEELRETFNLVRDVCGPDVSARFADHYYGTEQRLGQAFSNAVASSPDVRFADYERMTHAGRDPFFKDTVQAVEDALEDLTRAR